MKRLFGTDGMRGPAGKFPLDRDTVYVVGASLARHLAEKTNGTAPRVIVGRDTRESGDWLEAAIISGATDAGAVCQSAGVITTPGVAYLARNLDAGVVISASHNPYEDNGIKIFSPSGRKLDDATERLIEEDIQKTTPVYTEAGYTSKEYDGAEGLRSEYLAHLVNDIGAGINLHGMKLVVDCANGASSDLAPRLFEALGAEVVAINASPDGKNINLDCGSLHLEHLQQRVVNEQASLGVAFDGDADRALFTDANGSIVDGDATLWVLAQDLASKDQLVGGLVVATVMSNLGLEKALEGRGWKLNRTDVGDKYVLEELLSTRASIGGEQSGHIIFPQIGLAGDGMVTAICLLRAMTNSGRELNELVNGFTRYPQILVNVRVAEKHPFSDVPQIAAASEEVRKKLDGNGRLLLRYSGTEPLARVMIEGLDQQAVVDLAHHLAEVIKSSLG